MYPRILAPQRNLSSFQNPPQPLFSKTSSSGDYPMYSVGLYLRSCSEMSRSVLELGSVTSDK